MTVRNVMVCNVILYHTVLHNVMQCCIMWYYAVQLYNVMSHDASVQSD